MRTPLGLLRSAPPSYYRSVHSTTCVSRDVLARYNRPLLPPANVIPEHLDQIAPTQQSDAFRTTATAPVGTSLQEVPEPKQAETIRSKIAIPLPAMKEIDSSGSSSKSRSPSIVQGITIPPKPIPPGEEECCMSGCVHCVYTVYADDLETYTSALSSALEALKSGNVSKDRWPAEVRAMDQKGQSGEKLKRAEEEKVTDGLDPGMAAFLALENKLRKKQASPLVQ